MKRAFCAHKVFHFTLTEARWRSYFGRAGSVEGQQRPCALILETDTALFMNELLASRPLEEKRLNATCLMLTFFASSMFLRPYHTNKQKKKKKNRNIDVVLSHIFFVWYSLNVFQIPTHTSYQSHCVECMLWTSSTHW